MDRTSAYREIQPPRDLRHGVERLWWRTEITTPSRPTAHRVLPDGCVDIVFDLGAVRERRGSERAFVVGTMTCANRFSYTGRLDFLGIRFRPGTARRFLGIPVGELTDLRVPLEELPDWRRGVDRFVAELRGASGPAERVPMLARALRRRREPSAAPPAWLSRAVDELLGSGGVIRIGHLAEILGITRQHLSRRFNEEIGVPPKRFARIVRFRRVTDRARSAPANEYGPDWARIAHRCGYADQPHLISDFREFSGLTPETWLRRDA